MRTLGKVQLLLSLIVGAMLANCSRMVQTPESGSTQAPKVETQAQAQTVQTQTQTISILMPSYARISLTNGSSISGRLTEFDAQAQQLTLSRGERVRSVSFTHIEKVFFHTEEPGAPDPTPLMIRGESRTWSSVPASHFRILSDSQGQAEVRLPSGADSRIESDQGAIYALEAFSFSAENQLDIDILVLE